jgi:hypothetical protein
MPIVKSRSALPAALVTLGLCGCLGNSGSSSPAPQGVQAYAGDASISITWPMDPGVSYWVFHAQSPLLSTTGNWSSLLYAGVTTNAGSPATICAQGNYPPPTNLYPETPTKLFPATYFSVNGRTGSSAGGPGSALVGAVARPAGGPDAPWIPGAAIPAAVSAIGYGAVTPCGYSGRPASGIYVAVGPAATIYSAALAPTVAGALSPSHGNQPLNWVRANTPAGISEDLHGVASYSYASSANNPGVASVVFVAVGRGGTIVRSTDGQNWQQVTSVPTSVNLNAIAAAGSTFIAVGDSGVVLTSPDTLVWSINTNAAAVSTNSLNAIHCTSNTCVAVGANGTTLWSGNGGSTWASYPTGSNNWTGIAYGNFNDNKDALVTEGINTLTVNLANLSINTWVVVDAGGSYAYAPTSGGWISGSTGIASSIVAIDYTTRFVALDGAGNAYASYTGATWSPSPVGASNLSDAVAMRSNGSGYVAIGSAGSNASSF